MISNKINTGKFITEDEYKELVQRFKNPTIQICPNNITITISGPARAEQYLQELSIKYGLPIMEKGRYGISENKEIIAPGDAKEWLGQSYGGV